MYLSDRDIEKWLIIAYDVARCSPDPSTQIGSLVFAENGSMVGTGYNSFTEGIKPTREMLERENRYKFISHSERSAIFSVLAGGHTRPHTMISTWAACGQCALAIVSSGIRTLIRHKKEDETGRWSESIADGDWIMTQAGVKIVDYEAKLGCNPVLFGGELYYP